MQQKDDNYGLFPERAFPTSVFPRRILPWMGGNDEGESTYENKDASRIKNDEGLKYGDDCGQRRTK